MSFDKNEHSVHSLNYHLILVTKYRARVFNDEISEYAKNKFSIIGEKYGIKIIEWNHDKDHIHVLFKAKPTTNLTKLINTYKSASSRMIKKEYPVVKNKLWEQSFWSKSYFISTSGGAPLEQIKQYIKQQGA